MACNAGWFSKHHWEKWERVDFVVPVYTGGLDVGASRTVTSQVRVCTLCGLQQRTDI